MTLSTVGQALTRPYPVTIPMVLLVSLVPLYLVIAGRARVGVVHEPALALDRLLPLAPVWALVYGALYAFLIMLPVFVIQRRPLLRLRPWRKSCDASFPKRIVMLCKSANGKKRLENRSLRCEVEG